MNNSNDYGHLRVRSNIVRLRGSQILSRVYPRHRRIHYHFFVDKLTLTSVKLELTIASLDAMFLTLPDVLFQVSPMTRPSEDMEWMENR